MSEVPAGRSLQPLGRPTTPSTESLDGLDPRRIGAAPLGLVPRRLDTVAAAVGLFVLVQLACLGCYLALATSIGAEAALNAGASGWSIMLVSSGLLLVAPAAVVVAGLRRRSGSAPFPPPAASVWLTCSGIFSAMVALVMVWFAATGWDYGLL